MARWWAGLVEAGLVVGGESGRLALWGSRR